MGAGDCGRAWARARRMFSEGEAVEYSRQRPKMKGAQRLRSRHTKTKNYVSHFFFETTFYFVFTKYSLRASDVEVKGVAVAPEVSESRESVREEVCEKIREIVMAEVEEEVVEEMWGTTEAGTGGDTEGGFGERCVGIAGSGRGGIEYLSIHHIRGLPDIVHTNLCCHDFLLTIGTHVSCTTNARQTQW